MSPVKRYGRRVRDAHLEHDAEHEQQHQQLGQRIQQGPQDAENRAAIPQFDVACDQLAQEIAQTHPLVPDDPAGTSSGGHGYRAFTRSRRCSEKSRWPRGRSMVILAL